jgi:hypothetical protein
MYKQFSGSLIIMQLLSFVMSAMISSPLRCMDSIHTEARHDIIAYQIIPNADCRMQRTLAVLNKAYNKIIEEHYRLDKKCIERWMQEKNVPVAREKIFWNKDFTKCSWIRVRPWWLRNKLEITLLGVSADKNVIMKKKAWDDYTCAAIEESERPFFGQEGNAVYLYGYGYITSSFKNSCYANSFYTRDSCLQYSCKQSVIEYSLSFNGGAKTKGCYFGLENGDIIYNFFCLLNFPSLLKAFFNSTVVAEYDDNGEWVKRYALSRVNIPDDYTSYKKYFLEGHGNYESYDNLDYVIKNAIDNKYAQQQREKKMIEDMLEKK